jgi:hypothetical protein
MNQNDSQFLVSFEKQKFVRLCSTPTDVSSASTSRCLLYLSDSIHGHKHNYQNKTNIPRIIIIIIIITKIYSRVSVIKWHGSILVRSDLKERSK